jgi:signal transduction histidine kinase/ActR/RegA family two-component response regulator
MIMNPLPGLGPILVVDDNPNIVKLIQVNLEFEGYSTVAAYDGKDALEKAEKVKPALLILDILMPQLNGWQVLEALKQNPQTASIPVIVLTAMGQKEDQKRGWELGVSDYITKPFNPMRLLEVVNRIIRPPLATSIITPSPVHPVTRVALVGGSHRATAILQTLLGNSRIQIVGVAVQHEEDPAAKLAGKLKIFTTTDPYALCRLPDVDLLIESEPHLLDLEKVRQTSPNLEVLRGYAAAFMWSLVEEKEASEERARDLVKELHTKIKELNALHEAGKTISSTMNLEEILLFVLNVMGELVNAEGGGIYLEENGEFLLRASKGNIQLPARSVHSTATMIFRSKKTLVVSGVAAEIPGVQVVLVPFIAKEKDLGFCALIFNRVVEISPGDLTFLSTLASQAGVAIENAKLYQDATESKRQIEALLSKLVYAQEEERKIISAEIHDTIAQSLVSAYTKVQTCQAMLGQSQEAVAIHLEELKKLLSESIKEIRQIIFNLRPSTLDDLGLIPTLEHYIKKFEAENKKQVLFSFAVPEEKLPPIVETYIYRIVQEALTNVKKHSNAQKVEIQLSAENGKLILKISDDGKGFNWDEVREQRKRGDSVGISGMMERATLLGGTLKIETMPGKGTQLFVEVPVKS